MKSQGHLKRLAVGALASLLAGTGMALGSPALANPTDAFPKPASVQIKQQVTAAVNKSLTEAGADARPEDCYVAMRFSGKRPWVLVTMDMSQPVELCEQEDGFGRQLWSKSKNTWRLIGYESGVGPGACQRGANISASIWKAARRALC